MQQGERKFGREWEDASGGPCEESEGSLFDAEDRLMKFYATAHAEQVAAEEREMGTGK